MYTMRIQGKMTRREALASTGMLAQKTGAPQTRAPIVNGAEHAWVAHDTRFPTEMQTWRVDHVVISHVCYYGRDNSYARYCVKTYPGKFAAVGLLVGYRLYSPGDRENAGRLERLMKADGLSGLRLSPIYDRDLVWLNDPACYPLWKKAEELGAVFNIFLAPHQVGQSRTWRSAFPA